MQIMDNILYFITDPGYLLKWDYSKKNHIMKLVLDIKIS